MSTFTRRHGIAHWRRALGIAVAVVAALAPLGLPGSLRTSAATADVQKTTICFAVHNPGGVVLPGSPPLPADRMPQRVIGDQFQAGNSDPDKVILLVNGHSGWRVGWDFRPDFSIARNLAREGYLLIDYDRLGTGDSTYAYPGRATLTYAGQRQMLREVIEQIRGMTVLKAGEADPCAGMPSAHAGPSPKVILVGHSYGSGVVNGYPALYKAPDPGHVDALVEANGWACAPGSVGQQSGLCFGVRATAIVAERIAAEAGRDVSFFLIDGSFDPYVAWQPKVKAVDPVSCVNNQYLLLWPQATTADAYVDQPCNPSNWETVSSYELVSNTAVTDDISKTDADLPVLLTFTDHDGWGPPAGNPDDALCNPDPMHDVGCQQPLIDQWKQLCRCASHVSSWVMKNAGHVIEWDRNMPMWTDELASWLASNHLAPAVNVAPVTTAAIGTNVVATLPNTGSDRDRGGGATWPVVALILASVVARRRPRCRRVLSAW